MKSSARKRNSQFFMIVLMGVLSACNANGRRGIQAESTFEPSITEDGVKEFELVVTVLPPQRPSRGDYRSGGGGNGGPSGGAGRGGNSRPPQSGRNTGGPVLSPDDVDELIDEIIEEAGYCREGYSPLDRINEREQIIVRGQCNETATQDDKSQLDTLDDRSIPG